MPPEVAHTKIVHAIRISCFCSLLIQLKGSLIVLFYAITIKIQVPKIAVCFNITFFNSLLKENYRLYIILIIHTVPGLFIPCFVCHNLYFSAKIGKILCLSQKTSYICTSNYMIWLRRKVQNLSLELVQMILRVIFAWRQKPYVLNMEAILYPSEVTSQTLRIAERLSIQSPSRNLKNPRENNNQ